MDNLEDMRNVKNVYVIDVFDLNRKLEQAVGAHAVVTPSGAGPAMLIIASDPAVALRARIAAENIYRDYHHKAKAFDVHFS